MRWTCCWPTPTLPRPGARSRPGGPRGAPWCSPRPPCPRSSRRACAGTSPASNAPRALACTARYPACATSSWSAGARPPRRRRRRSSQRSSPPSRRRTARAPWSSATPWPSAAPWRTPWSAPTAAARATAPSPSTRASPPRAARPTWTNSTTGPARGRRGSCSWPRTGRPAASTLPARATPCSTPSPGAGTSGSAAWAAWGAARRARAWSPLLCSPTRPCARARCCTRPWGRRRSGSGEGLAGDWPGGILGAAPRGPGRYSRPADG
mmetsp:Transcript_4168/g.13930  ORF Transcript_4168/g.13930 Transcript_4168/m.13930 type:complete len:266 (-) Transcript_4168:1446-2243(-)